MNPATGLFDISGKTAIVTGGASGIGLMITRGLVEQDVKVFFTSRKPEALDAASEELDGLGAFCGIQADLSADGSVDAMAATVRQQTDTLDLLVNNAGTTWYSAIDEYPDAAFDRCFDVNVKAPFSLTRRVLPLLRSGATPADPARIVNIGSIGGISPGGTDNYAYPASKAALHMLTRQMALALARDHITVNAVAPGPFKTKMMAPAMRDEAAVDAVADSVPLGRWGEPSDIVGAVTYLASRAASYVTGTVLVVDGGSTAG